MARHFKSQFKFCFLCHERGSSYYAETIQWLTYFYSSTAARIGIPNHEAIAASKAGIEALVRSAAASYSNRNIRFNCIAPGLTDTDLAKPITSNPQALEISKKMSPLNAIAQPDDIASLTAWLASDAAKFVTGQCFTVDGGLSATVPKPRA